MPLSPLRRLSAGIALALALSVALHPVYGFVNEAISAALDAATPYVEDSFEVREDNWSGQVEPGKPLLVRHQLFRGNEYWFWAGTSWPGATVEVQIFDGKGDPIGLEQFSSDGKAGVRALPKSTGTYFIQVIINYEPPSDPAELAELENNWGAYEGSVDWGLVYGYR
ncbi:MAG: hypothetical protein AAF236_08480 [Verrucomicrobiota bacterium]